MEAENLGLSPEQLCSSVCASIIADVEMAGEVRLSGQSENPPTSTVLGGSTKHDNSQNQRKEVT